MVFLCFLMLLVGFALTWFGADRFVEEAANISKILGWSQAIVGMFIVSFATTAPEFFVSTIGAINGHVDVTIGNAIGSCALNIGLVFALSVVFVPTSSPEAFTKKGLWLVFAIGVVWVFALDGVVSRAESALMLLLFLLWLKSNAPQEADPQAAEEKGAKRRNVLKHLLLLGLWFLVLFVGSRLIVAYGVKLSRALGIPERVIALTLVAFGTSIPELATALASIIKGHRGIAVGNILGANVFDTLFIFGVDGLIRPLPARQENLRFDMPVTFLLSLLFLAFGITGKRFTRAEGLVLFLLYVAYTLALYRVAPNLPF